MSVSIIQISPIKMKYLEINLTKHTRNVQISIQNSLMKKRKRNPKIDISNPLIRRHNIVNVN